MTWATQHQVLGQAQRRGESVTAVTSRRRCAFQPDPARSGFAHLTEADATDARNISQADVRHPRLVA